MSVHALEVPIGYGKKPENEAAQELNSRAHAYITQSIACRTMRFLEPRDLRWSVVQDDRKPGFYFLRGEIVIDDNHS